MWINIVIVWTWIRLFGGVFRVVFWGCRDCDVDKRKDRVTSGLANAIFAVAVLSALGWWVR